MWQEKYIDALRAEGLEATARAAAGVTKRTVEKALQEDPDFAATVEDAMEKWADTLEREAYRRAVEGVEKGVYHQGVLVATERQFSDTLLSQMLKAHRKERYAPELTLKGTGKNGAITVNVRNFDNPEAEDLA